jgi:hypothetical protein
MAIGFDNPLPGRDRPNLHSHTVLLEKTDHRLLSRSKGGNPKGLEQKKKLLKPEEFEVFSIVQTLSTCK